MAFPRGYDCFRLSMDQVVHNRKVVRSKVPYDVDVMLKETEIDARRVVVIQISQNPVVDKLPDLLHCPREEKGVVHHDPEISPCRNLDQFLGLRRCGSEGLLNEDM